MRSPASVLVVGLDACDPLIARRFAAAGHLPALSRLFEMGAGCPVQNPFGLFVGALWISFATGLRAERHQVHCWDEIDVATYERRLVTPQLGDNVAFWQHLSEAGRRVAVIDVPHCRADIAINGLQLVEWGCHDRHFGFHTWPPKRAADIESAFGLHPVLGIDPYAVRDFAADDYIHRAGSMRSFDEDRLLLEGLRGGLEVKGKLCSALLAEGGWDLFLAVFGESHAIGHQQWHFHDRTHPHFDAKLRDALDGDPLLQIYRRLDQALSELLAQVDDRTTVLVLLSHGMGPHYDGAHLLEEVLTRIDLADRGPPVTKTARDLVRRGMRELPPLVQRQAMAFAVPVIRTIIDVHNRPPVPEYTAPHIRARQKFFREPNETVYGGVRLNVIGREPNGCVEPHDVERVCARLRKDLLALVNVDTGGPVIRAVERSDVWHGRSPTDTLPDLFVTWERSAPIETVWSAKAGLLHAPYTHWRTGDHREHGFLLASGPGIPTGARLPPIAVEDLAPSIAARLGVDLPEVDGRIVSWLRASSTKAA